jgi:hypothetical protein
MYLCVLFQMDNFTDYMGKFGSEVGLAFNLMKEQSLPPASLQTFLAASSDIPGVVLTDHGSHYLNK